MSSSGPVEADRDLLAIVLAYLQRSDWDVEQQADRRQLRAAVEGPSGRFDCFVRVHDAEQQIAIYSICPRHAPSATRAATGEFLHRLNFGMVIGNFELDPDDGEIRCKASLDVEGEPITDVQLAKLLDVSVLSISRYLPLLEAVVDGAMTPLQAMEHV